MPFNSEHIRLNCEHVRSNNEYICFRDKIYVEYLFDSFAFRLQFLWSWILESVNVQDHFLGILFGMICEHNTATDASKSQKVCLGVESAPDVCSVPVLIK